MKKTINKDFKKDFDDIIDVFTDFVYKWTEISNKQLLSDSNEKIFRDFIKIVYSNV